MTQTLLPSGFKYISELGSGGTARVVSVNWDNYKKPVALKIPLPNVDDQEQTFSNLAQREWQFIGGLSFPGLVRILKVATKPEEYIALELCQGPTLDTIGRIENLNSALNIFSALAINLEFLRLKGIIHGDLKPHNYFLPSDWQSISRTDRLFHTKLSDFSLGKFNVESDDSRLGVGTVGYLAPETISENITSIKSDLFALGVIAYQIFTGVHPFMENESDPVIINSRCQEEKQASVNELIPEISEEIAAIINSLLSKDPNDRPNSGWEVCQHLETVGATYPFRKALRPSACLHKELTYEDNVNALIETDSVDLERLSIISNSSNDILRLILSHNFNRNNLSYNGNNYTFKNNILWPNKLRNKSIGKYSELSFTNKKNIIKAGIIGSIENCIKLDLLNKDEIALSFSDTVLLIKQLISLPTIKKFSFQYASIAERKEHIDMAADLYLQSGEISKAAECAYQAGTTLHADHKSNESLKIIKHIIDYADTSGKLFENRDLLMLQGDIQKDIGEVESAFNTYNKLISLYDDQEPDKILAETYKDLGDLFKIKQQFDEGLESLNKALEIYYLLNDKLEISHTLNNIGNIYWVASKFDNALINYRKALRIQRQLNALEDTASTLSNIASIYALKGSFKRGIKLLNLSLRLKKAIGNKVEIARTLNNLGYCFYCCGDQYKAVNSLTESLELNRQVGNKKEILYNLENLTAIMITAGQLKESLNYLKEGISISEQVGDRNHYGIFQMSMATVLRRMGQYGQADKCLATVIEIVDQSDNDSLKIILLNALASIRLAIGDDRGAEDISNKAKNKAEEIDNRPEKLNSLLILTKINNSTEIFDQALLLADELSLNRERILIKNNMLSNYLISDIGNNLQDLIVEIEGSLQSMKEDVEISGIYINLAEYYLQNNQEVKAINYADKALQNAQLSNLIPEMIKSNILQGKIKFTSIEYEACFDYYKKAMKLTQQISSGLITEVDKQLFQKNNTTQSLISEINKFKKQTVH